jgi:transposase
MAFVNEAKNHGLDCTKIKEVCTDMSTSFINGVTQHLPNASLTFDKFHIIKHLNDALDIVRRQESKTNPILKGTRYTWLKNPDKLSEKEKENLKTLSKENIKTAKVYRMKLTFQDIYKRTDDKETAALAIKKWLSWSCRSRIEPIITFGKMVKSHFEGVIRYWDSGLTNAAVEATNTKIQEVKRRSRGFRNVKNFISMVYLVCGDLPLDNIICKIVSPRDKKRPAHDG